MEKQLNILAESLDRKIQILKQIEELNEAQTRSISKEEADLDEFDRVVDQKDVLIDEITRLDDGFETVYEKLAEELKTNRDKYAVQIKSLQEKIVEVTERSVSIQAQEARNKKLVEDYFVKMRSGIKRNRQTSQAAYNYYRNMSGAAYASSRFMDNKQ
ncbi:MAG: flagellar export chaperone FlgN [Lachnospiraceae bacterium]|nr:flagellar export chaperone FlgN [Lachnospiraceae bacterium]